MSFTSTNLKKNRFIGSSFKFGGNLFFISMVFLFFFLNPIKSCRLCLLFSNFKDTTSLRVTMQQAISTTYKYTSKKENPPTNRGLFHDFRFSPGYDNLQQDGISEAVGSLTVFLHTAGKGASCPYCGHFSHRLHSYYSRHIQDLEVYGHTLELVIKVGKYYCENVSCPRKIFCEPLSFLARRYGRRSYLVEERIRSISLELTSRKASSLLQLFHINGQ